MGTIEPLLPYRKFQQKPKAEAKVDTRNPYGIDKKIPMKNVRVFFLFANFQAYCEVAGLEVECK